MPKTVCIFGGSGFVGRYVVRRMQNAGWAVRIPSRKPPKTRELFKDINGVDVVAGDIRDDFAVERALDGVNAVVFSVGTFDQYGAQNFSAIQHFGASRVAELSEVAGVKSLVHISAIGADFEAQSLYQKSKAQGEAAVSSAFETATILRPSVIFGPEDQFFNRFAAMTRFNPILPLVGGSTLFQPVYVDDVAAAVEAALLKRTKGVFELGGPEVASFRDLMVQMLKIKNRERMIIDTPMPIARLMGWGFDLMPRLTGGVLPSGPITLDQVKSLAHDNIVAKDARGFDALGITPKSVAEILPSYL